MNAAHIVGGSLATGRGCCKAGSITQASEAVSFQATPGNTDCSTPLVGSTTSYLHLLP